MFTKSRAAGGDPASADAADAEDGDILTKETYNNVIYWAAVIGSLIVGFAIGTNF